MVKPLTRASPAKLQDLVEVGAVREDLRRDRVEHRSARLAGDDVGGAGDVCRRGSRPGRRRVDDAPTVGSRRGSSGTGAAPRLRVDVGVADHPAPARDRCRGRRQPAAASPASASGTRTPVRGRGRQRRDGAGSSGSRRSRLPARRAVERRARGPREGPRARPFPWPRPAGSRQRPYGSRASRIRRIASAASGNEANVVLDVRGSRTTASTASQTSSTMTPSRSRKTARSLTCRRLPRPTPTSRAP